MVLNEWKYAFDRVLQWSKWDGKKNLSSAIELQRFFPDNRELFGNESNKKKTYSNLDLCCLCFCWSTRGRSNVSTRGKHGYSFSAMRLFSVFTALTYRWHHWSKCLVQSCNSHSVCILGYGYTCGSPLPPMWWKQKILSLSVCSLFQNNDSIPSKFLVYQNTLLGISNEWLNIFK